MALGSLEIPVPGSLNFQGWAVCDKGRSTVDYVRWPHILLYLLQSLNLLLVVGVSLSPVAKMHL